MKFLQRKYLALVNRSNVVLLLDNAKPLPARITPEKILDLSWFVLLHPLYSPRDYHFFPSVRNDLNDKKLSQENQAKTLIFLSSKPAEFYLRRINKQPDQKQEVIENNSDNTN